MSAEKSIARTPSAGVTRRQALITGSAAIVGAAIGAGIVELAGGSQRPAAVAAPSSEFPASESPQVLSMTELVALQAVLDRLIPSDQTGPGAKEAKVWRYIDINLGGHYTSLQPIYSQGLAALDAYAQQSQGKTFARLDAALQDQILKGMEAGAGLGGAVGQTFFRTVRNHALEGMFGDPAHGGNAEFIGWQLIGYPGPYLVVRPEYQQLGAKVPLLKKSTYDFPNFRTPE